MTQLEWIYFQLNSLPVKVIVSIIDELGILESDYKDMTHDIYKRAKQGYRLSDKQKNVLVNAICQPPKE